MVDIVSAQRHLMCLGQTLAVDRGGAGGVAVGGAQLRRGGRETSPGGWEGGGEGVGGGHLQSSGVIMNWHRGGGVHWLAPPNYADSLWQTERVRKLAAVKGIMLSLDIRIHKHKWLMFGVCFSIPAHYRRIGLKFPHITHTQARYQDWEWVFGEKLFTREKELDPSW